MDTPLVSIIISTKNRYGEFIKCLESVKEHTKVPHEIIIVDAGSTDGTREKLSDGTLGNNISILLQPPVPGYAQGNNLAMKMAKGKYIYLLNNDNWVTNNWLEHMIELYERNPKIGHMSSLILWPDDKVQSAGANVTNDGASISICSGACVKNVPTIPIECDYAGFGLYRKDVLEKVNYLSEEFYPIYFDDTDYGLKVKAAGYKVVCCTLSRIYHACSNEGRDRWDKEGAYGRNHKIFIDKWKDYLRRR